MVKKIRNRMHQVGRVDPRLIRLVLAVVSLIVFVIGASAPAEPSPWGGP